MHKIIESLDFHTLYRARLSKHGVGLTADVEPVALFVVLVAFASPKFFNEPIDPFNKSGLSTSGPPNSCSCCSQQQSIASIPSSTLTLVISQTEPKDENFMEKNKKKNQLFHGKYKKGCFRLNINMNNKYFKPWEFT